MLDDVTRGWGGGESLLFRRRVGQGHERPFTSTAKPQRFTLTTLQTADTRKPPKKQGCGKKQDVFTGELCGRCDGCLHQKFVRSKTHHKTFWDNKARLARGRTVMKPAYKVQSSNKQVAKIRVTRARFCSKAVISNNDHSGL